MDMSLQDKDVAYSVKLIQVLTTCWIGTYWARTHCDLSPSRCYLISTPPKQLREESLNIPRQLRCKTSALCGVNKGTPLSTTGGRDIWNILALFCWHTLHLIFIVIAYIATIIEKSRSLLFPKESLKKSRASQRKKPRIVGVVIESEEVETEMSKVCKLLMWLADIGVQHVSLYDMEGLLKQSKRSLEKTLSNLNTHIQLISTWEEHEKWMSESQITEQPIMTVELLSICDGKEGIAKAARYLCANTLQKINSEGQHIDLKLTEADINRGLEATGCAGPEPDLLLVFGFTRCLLGFPAWRLPFTEIIYMGMFNSLTLDSLLDAVDEFSTKNQRYGK